MINVASFHQIMPLPWNIITHSTSKKNISKSKTSRLKNTTHMIKVASYRQLMSRPWRIVTTAGLGPAWEFVRILHKPHIPDISSHNY